jgi:flagellar protein FliO/FliZ
MLLEMVMFLVLIIGLIVGLGWLVRRMGNFTAGAKGAVTILGGVSVGPRERAVLLQVDKKRLLVGVAPGRVQTLCMLDDAEESESFQEQLDSALQEGEQ